MIDNKKIIENRGGSVNRNLAVLITTAAILFMMYGVNPFSENVISFGYVSAAYGNLSLYNPGGTKIANTGCELNTTNSTNTCVNGTNLTITGINNTNYCSQEGVWYITMSLESDVASLNCNTPPGTWANATYSQNNCTNASRKTHLCIFPPTSPRAVPLSNYTYGSGKGGINITWTDNSNVEENYSIERKVEGGSFIIITNVSKNVNNYVNNDLNDSTTYTYRIRAFNTSSGGGTFYSNYTIEFSNTTIDRTNATLTFYLPTPANNTYTNKNNTEINLSIVEPNLDTFKFSWNNTNYTIYDPSLVLAMNFNNNTAIGENTTKAVDISQYRNNGTISGATWTTAGKFGSALSFNGINSYVDAGNSGSLNITTAITAEAWIKLVAAPTTSQMIIEKGTSSTDSVYWLYVTNAGNLKGGVNISGWKEVSDGGSVSVGVWHHVAMTYDGSQVQLWLDGVQTGTSAAATGNISKNNLDLIIGKYSSYYFNGTIDEVRIYNRSLTASEILLHYLTEFSKYNATDWRYYSNITNLGDGVYNYYGWANDTAGNSGVSETRKLTIDTTAPTITFVSPTDVNDANVSRSFTYINVTVTDNYSSISTCTLQWNGTNQSMTKVGSGTSVNCYLNKTGLSDGTYSYKVFANDSAKNIGVSETRNITIDTTAPEIIINAPGSETWQKSSFAMSVSDSDDGSGLQLCKYRVFSNGTLTKDWTSRTCNSENSMTITVGSSGNCRDEGRHNCTVEVIAWDNVNNNYSVNRTFHIDYTAPSAPQNVNDSVEGWSFLANRTFNWTNATDAVSGVAGFYYAIDSATPENGGGYTSDLNYTIETLSEGNHTFYVKAVDVAGNIGDYGSHEFLILSSKGIISTTPGATPFWTNTSNPLIYSDLACLGEMQAGEECNVSWFVNATGASGTRYQFYVIFESLNFSQVLKNQTNITYIEIRTENTPPPKVNLTSPANNSGTEHDRNMTFVWESAVDPDGDPITYYLSVDNDSDFGSPVIDISTANTNYTSTTDLDLETSYYWRVRAYDSMEFGNYSNIWNFSIEPFREVELYVESVEFGELGISGYNDTTDDIPLPLRIRNTGNIVVNVSINATNLWSAVSNGTAYYKFKVDKLSTELGSFDYANSQTSWYNLNVGLLSAIRDLNYQDDYDEAEIDIYVEVPPEEGGGVKNSTITVKAS